MNSLKRYNDFKNVLDTIKEQVSIKYEAKLERFRNQLEKEKKLVKAKQKLLEIEKKHTEEEKKRAEEEKKRAEEEKKRAELFNHSLRKSIEAMRSMGISDEEIEKKLGIKISDLDCK